MSLDDASALEDIDCILVLGAGVKDNKTPSAILAERLDLSVDLYNSGVCNKLLMSGDHAQDNYNEVQVMKDYAAARNFPTEDIFMDHAGFLPMTVYIAQKRCFRLRRYYLYPGNIICREPYIWPAGWDWNLTVFRTTIKLMQNTQRKAGNILAFLLYLCNITKISLTA